MTFILYMDSKVWQTASMLSLQVSKITFQCLEFKLYKSEIVYFCILHHVRLILDSSYLSIYLSISNCCYLYISDCSNQSIYLRLFGLFISISNNLSLFIYISVVSYLNISTCSYLSIYLSRERKQEKERWKEVEICLYVFVCEWMCWYVPAKGKL